MGCISSNFSYDSSEISYGANMPGRSTPRKRNFSSRVESTVTTDESRHYSSASSWSHCSTPTPPNHTTKSQLKRSVFPKLNRKDMPKALAKLTLGDKMPKTKQETPRQQDILEHSNGYFSGSTDNLDSSCSSSLSQNSLLLHTRDMSKSCEISTASSNASQQDADQPVSNLKMEILMMRDIIQLMPKTSSPFCARRGAAAASTGNVNYINYPPSDTYCLWRQYLEGLPAYSLHNVTAIPEAIAGQFSPSNHPAYTELQNFECVSAPKRYRIQPRKGVHSAPSVPLAAVVPDYGVTRIIESTEL